jgi:membrane-associated protease RseP (regulator of RpoE activity)
VQIRALVLATFAVACAAVYPEVSTPLRAPPADFRFEPPPPADVYFIRFKQAIIPKKTRDGRRWDSVGGEAPDPYAKILVNSKDLIVTSLQSDTLTPTWPDQEPANYRIRASDRIVVELWDSNPLNNLPICSEAITDIGAAASSDEPFLEINCDNGGRVELIVEPAHGKLGLGMQYELRTEQAFLTRVLKESPAGRAKLRAGDEILRVQGTPVATMEEGKLQSLINANASLGVTLTVQSAQEAPRDVTIRDGSVFPLHDEGVPLQ